MLLLRKKLLETGHFRRSDPTSFGFYFYQIYSCRL